MRVVVLETLIRRAPLGMRFIDLARGVAVSDSLVVRAWPLTMPTLGRYALCSPLSGVYGFRTLPGLHGYEVGAQAAEEWCGSPPSGPLGVEPGDFDALHDLVDANGDLPLANFVVAIEDRQGRFLSQTLLVCLPKEHMLEVPLFSAPARATPSGLGVVRGEVWVRGAGPAAWALVTARADSAATYAAVTDERGMFALFLPYAGPLPPLVGSPPYGGTALERLSWSLTIEVFYKPVQQRRVAWLTPPDTRSILDQPAAHVYAFDAPAGRVTSLERPILFGQDLVVATSGRSRLLIDSS